MNNPWKIKNKPKRRMSFAYGDDVGTQVAKNRFINANPNTRNDNVCFVIFLIYVSQ